DFGVGDRGEGAVVTACQVSLDIGPEPGREDPFQGVGHAQVVALTEPGDEQGEPVQDAVYGGADPVRGHIEGRELIRLSEDLVQVGVVHEVPVLDQRIRDEPLGELGHGGGAQDVTLDAQVGQV